MEDEIDRLVIAVRADTGGFGRDVAAMKGSLAEGLGTGAERAGRSIETALSRAVRTGSFGFEELKGTALRALGEIAAAAVKGGVASAGGGAGLAGIAGGLLKAVLGLPGRATGGPVSPGAAYVVGERGPELFVPTASGAVVPSGGGGGAREVKVSIAVAAGAGGDAPRALARSSAQVARAVRRALEEG